MEHSNKNITNAAALISESEMNLVRENGETQQASIKDEDMQDLFRKRYCSARGHYLRPKSVSKMLHLSLRNMR
ncbi:hypothetical protein TNCV_2006161 [Trichonephila clavipes]|nr:hypothetical protein TNCV_2006161 [Trichonephila clavipes]